MKQSFSPTTVSKIFPRIALTALLVASLPGSIQAAAGDVFEGRVKMEISEGGTDQTIDYFIKGDQMRIETEDPNAQQGAMILDMREKEMLVLMPRQKMYMTMPLPDLGANATDETKDPSAEIPEPTGQTRKILGHTAQQYLMEDGETEYEIWATEELGTFGGLRIPGAQGPGAASPRDRALAGQEFFPLLIIERRNGREATRVEVTEIEPKDLPESLFKAPDDFRGMNVPFQLPQ